MSPSSEALADDLRTQAIKGLKAARNAVLLDDLVAVVQVCAPPMAWTTVAGFDLAVVAEEYARRCQEQTPAGANVLVRVVRLSK